MGKIDTFLKYNNDLPYSYVFGAFGTIELLKNRKDECLAVIIDPSFINNETYKLIVDLCKDSNIDIIVNLGLINKLRDKGNIFVIGVFKKYKSSLTTSNHIVLYNVDDLGTVGTIIRSMRGFNYDNLVLINCDVDIYNEHLIRSTMGAFFSCNIETFASLNDYLSKYKKQKIINISTKGNDLNLLTYCDNMSLIFSLKNIDYPNATYYKFEEDISLDNIVNIVLFKLFN